MAEGMVQSGQNVRISFGVCKPHEGCHIDDVVAHLVGVAACIEKRSGNSQSDISMTILRSIRGNWAAVLAERKGKADANPYSINLPEAASFTKGLCSVVRMVDYGWFELNCEENKERCQVGKKRIGDVFGVRRIYSGGKNQEKLAYSCLAVLKSYFTKTEGLHSYTFYNSLDGKLIIGLGKWESVDTASTAMNKPNGFPWEAFWNCLGVKKLKYDICRVVYVTDEDKE